MRNGPGDREAGRYSCPCGCPVHSAAESEEDSVCHFAVLEMAAVSPGILQKLVVVQ